MSNSPSIRIELQLMDNAVVNLWKTGLGVVFKQP